MVLYITFDRMVLCGTKNSYSMNVNNFLSTFIFKSVDAYLHAYYYHISCL